MAGGRRFHTIGADYHYLKQELDEHPTSAELHRRLANVLKNGDRPDLALPYYYKAIELDPGEAESLYNLAEVLIEQERYREAIPHVEALVPYCRDGQMEEDSRRHLFGWLLEQTTVIEQHTQQRIELFPTASKQETSTLDEAGEKDPAVVYLTSFDLSDADDFEDVYQMFRTGRVPETSRYSPERLRRSGHGEVLTLPEPEPVRTVSAPIRHQKVGRNAPCPCGSGKKYKKCCGR
jgi:tetratricopeptide (TPR) repeat protein